MAIGLTAESHPLLPSQTNQNREHSRLFTHSRLPVSPFLKNTQGMKVMMGIDDMDVFKGIELKLQAMELLLEQHREWVGKLVLVQVRPSRYILLGFL